MTCFVDMFLLCISKVSGTRRQCRAKRVGFRIWLSHPKCGDVLRLSGKSASILWSTKASHVAGLGSHLPISPDKWKQTHWRISITSSFTTDLSRHSKHPHWAGKWISNLYWVLTMGTAQHQAQHGALWAYLVNWTQRMSICVAFLKRAKAGREGRAGWARSSVWPKIDRRELCVMACDAGYMHVYIYQNENQTAKQKNHCTVHLQYTDYFLSYFFFVFERKGLMQIVFQSRLELLIALPQLLECWNSRRVSWCLNSSEWFFFYGT